MNADVARAILSAAKEGGYFEDAIPDDEETLLSNAEFYYRHAETAVEQGKNDPVILQIAALGKPKPTDGYTDTAETHGPEQLPVPPQIEGEVPVMPRDLSAISDKDIRKLSGEYNACLARATWLLSEALTTTMNSTILRDDAYQRAFLEEGREAIRQGAKSTKDDKDAAAKQNPEYKEWEGKVRAAEEDVRRYKALKEIYSGHIDRLSREATLRDDEYRRSGR